MYDKSTFTYEKHCHQRHLVSSSNKSGTLHTIMMVVFGGGIKWPEQTGNLESKQRWTVPQNEYVEKK